MWPREPGIFDVFQIDGLSLPPRSRLFNLPPIALGTGRVEGLISYLVRLARAHSVNPRRLVKTEFALVPGIDSMTYAAFFDRYAGTLDGLGHYAEVFSNALAQLTGGSDLSLLTLLPLRELLPPNGQGLLAGGAKWCPACLDEMMKAHTEVHRPLVWSFALYRMCGRHGQPLEDRCAACGHLQPFLPRYPDLARCDHCGAGLNSQSVPRRDERSALDVWLAEAIEDIVAHLAELDGIATQGRFVTAVRAAVAKHAAGNQAEFCRRIGMRRWAIKGWLSKGECPSLPQLLTVCHGLNVMPTELLLSESVPDRGLRMQADIVMARAARPVLSIKERQRLASDLSRLTADPNDTAPVSKVAQRLGLKRSCLKYWFAEHQERIHGKYVTAKNQRADHTRKRNEEKVICVVTEMVAHGKYPGRRRVNEALRRQGLSLAQPEMKAIYLKALARLSVG